MLLRLHRALGGGNRDRLLEEIHEVLKSPYFSASDFLSIAELCNSNDLPAYRQATLEIARERHQFNNDILLTLADAYDDSPNQQIKERGRLMMENFLNVTYKDGKPVLVKTPAGRGIGRGRAIGILFNFYIRANKWEWVLSIADSAQQLLGRDIVLERNRALALSRLDRNREAEESYRSALEMDPSDDDTLSWYSDFLDDQGKYEEAYKLAEQAVLADPEASRFYAYLGESILNRGFARNAEEAIVGPLSRKNERLKYAVPLFEKAIQSGNVQIRQRIIRLLVRSGEVHLAQCIDGGETPPGEFDPAVLSYLQNRAATR